MWRARPRERRTIVLRRRGERRGGVVRGRDERRGAWFGDATSCVGAWFGDAASGVRAWFGDAKSGVRSWFVGTSVEEPRGDAESAAEKPGPYVPPAVVTMPGAPPMALCVAVIV